MSYLSLHDIDRDVMAGLAPPRRPYKLVMGFLAAGILWAAFCWLYQVKRGMGVAGINHPVAWAVYITNFVFWIGIGHAGTLISAILHLVRSRWRAAVSRSAEAMTVFAVVTASLFPLIHLGRVWVFYYIIPYPSQRQLWPNFVSPLVWDVVAVTTYLTVSTIFWLVGLLPDVASARDRTTLAYGPSNERARFYDRMSLGWTGSSRQWRHFGRAYLFFAALATPLVVSVHSVVSWDFAMTNLPGWHTTIFAPYFVAGAIHSGLAMVLVLMIPMRKLLHLERLVRVEHFEAAAKTMVVTALIVGYAYVIEPFIAWYSGDLFEKQFAWYRATGWFAWAYWSLTALNVLVPLAFLFRRLRRSIPALLAIALLVNVGMWLERWVIIAGSLSHDFMPHNWNTYAPTWVEISITAGSFAFFLFFFLGFAKTLPTVAASDVKELTLDKEGENAPPKAALKLFRQPLKDDSGVLAVFSSPGQLVGAVKTVACSSFDRVEAFSPFRIDEVSAILHKGPSPVRYWTLAGALSGCAGGFALAIGASMVNNLWVGAKFTPTSYIPYCIVAFEGTVLLGTLANLTGMLVHTGLGRRSLNACYDRRFTSDRFGLFVACEEGRRDQARAMLAAVGAEEVRDVR